MHKADEEIQPHEYNRILKGIQFLRVYLQSSNCSLYDQKIIKGVKLNVDEKSRFETDEEGNPTVFYTFKITGKSGRTKAIEMECCFAVAFSAQEKVSDSFMRLFSVTGVRFLCFPYAREYFSSITTRMDLPAFFLPLLKISPSPQMSPQGSEK